MPSPIPASATPVHAVNTTAQPGNSVTAQRDGGRVVPTPAVAPANPGGGQRADSAEEGEGRRILSTAFVRVGADGHLTVTLRDGRELVLRNVVMRARDYCGVQVAGAKFCGGYGDVAGARAGGGPPVTEIPEPATRPAAGQ